MGNEWGYYDANGQWVADTYAGAITRVMEDQMRERARPVDDLDVLGAVARVHSLRNRHEWWDLA